MGMAAEKLTQPRTWTQVVAGLQHVKEQPHGIRAACPTGVHEKNVSSFSLRVVETASGKRARAKCFAGCTEEAITAALGVAPANIVIDDDAQRIDPAATASTGNPTAGFPAAASAAPLAAAVELDRIEEVVRQSTSALLALPHGARDRGRVADFLQDRVRPVQLSDDLGYAEDQPAVESLLRPTALSVTPVLGLEGKGQRARLVIAARSRRGVDAPTGWGLVQGRALNPETPDRFRWMPPKSLTGATVALAGTLRPADLHLEEADLPVVVVTEGLTDLLTAAFGARVPAVGVRGAANTSATAVADVAGALAIVADDDAVYDGDGAEPRLVVLAGDHDEAGGRFNAGMQAALQGLGHRVAVLSWGDDDPDGEDFSSLYARIGRDALLARLAALDPAPVGDAPATEVDRAFEEITEPLAPPRAALPPAVTEVPTAAVFAETVTMPLTELGLAERVRAVYGHAVRWVRDRHPVVWDGRVWTPVREADGDLDGLYFSTVRAAKEYEPLHLPPVLDEDGRVDEAATRSARAARAVFFEKAETRRSKAAVLEILRGLPGMTEDKSLWDADDLIVNTPTGILDLRTGKHRPHDPEARCTMITAGSGELDLPVPEAWEKVLAGVALSAPDNPALLEAFAAVACTGRVEKFFLHVYGSRPDVGKSSIGLGMRLALGTYATTIDPKLIAAAPNRTGDTPDPGWLSLQAKRLVYGDEAASQTVDANRLKSATSGEEMKMRYGHSNDQVAWRSQMSLLLSGNAELHLNVTDDAVVRRLHVMHLTEPVRRDPALRDKLLQQETVDGVLAWMLRAAVAWVRDGGAVYDGLRIPASAAAQRAAYVESIDPLAAFLDERVERFTDEPGDPASATTSELHAAYQAYCRRHGSPGISQKAFVRGLVARGCVLTRDTARKRSGARKPTRGTFVEGLRLLDPHEGEEF